MKTTLQDFLKESTNYKGSYYIHPSIWFDTHKYDTQMMKQALTNNGVDDKDIWLENAFGWENQPEVVCFKATKEELPKLKVALWDALDAPGILIYPISGKGGWKSKKPKVNESVSDEDNERELVFSAETKGKKYAIKVYKKKNVHGAYYELVEYTNNVVVGRGSRNTEEGICNWIKDTIKGSAEIDDINYIVSFTKLPV